jgi:membrane-bound ClpP family serine protease
MNIISRTITGISLVILGIALTIIAILYDLFILIYSIPAIIIGFFIFFNKKEDDIEKIKNNKNK